MDPLSPQPAHIYVPEGKAPRRGLRTAVIATSAMLVVGAGAGAFAVGSYLSGGGTQPDDVLRSGAVAFAKLDLDPAANQKIAVYQLSKKFPGLLADQGADGVGDSLLGKAFADGDLSYERDIQPWLGERAGVAVYAPAAKGKEPRFAVAVEYTDEAVMSAALKKEQANEPDLRWSTRDGYVVITATGDPADLVAPNGAESLAAQADYTGDVAALDGDQIAVAWADFGRIASFALDAASAELGGMAPAAELAQLTALQSKVAGRFAMGVHAEGDHLDLQGKMFGLEGAAWSGRTAGTNLAGTMPADSVGALSVTGLGPLLAQQWKGVAGLPGFGDMTGQFGLKLPADFTALFGQETAAALLSSAAHSPAVAVRARGGDLARANELLSMLTSAFGIDAPVAQKVADGFVVATDAATAKAAAAGAARLADTDSFKRAVPNAADAGFVLYANLTKALGEELGAEASPELKALDAVGFTATAGEDPTFLLRLTTRQ